MMDFSWDDSRFIHPVWPKRLEQLPTIIIGSSQKNGRVQEIPMMPGLLQLLEQTPTAQRTGWIVNPAPLECLSRFREGAFRPSTSVLTRIAKKFSNLSIARACGVSEASVRNWLAEAAEIPERRFQINSELPEPVIQELRLSAEAQSSRENSSHGRMSVERVGRIICRIGKAADVVVQAADRRTGQRKKFASAHDIRRGCAQRLINLGVSAETLKVVMRHESFATTEKHYGAVRSAQSAAAEIAAKLRPSAKNSELVGGLVGGLTNGVGLNAEEINALKSLLQRL
jgi:hypothetical protein